MVTYFSFIRRKIALLSLFLCCCAPATPFVLEQPNVDVFDELSKKLVKVDVNVPHHYALLINTSTEDRHRNNLALSYQVLLENGYAYQDIIILDANGFETPAYPLTDELTRQKLINALEWFKGNLKKEDTFLLYITGHGLPTSIPLNSFEVMKKDRIESYFNEFNTRLTFIFVDVCYWEFLNVPTNRRMIYISVAEQTNTSSGVSFPRLFWNRFREYNETSIYDAFDYAKETDKNTKVGKNSPVMFFSTDPFVSLLGKRVI